MYGFSTFVSFNIDVKLTWDAVSMPYNSSTPVLWVNKDLMKKAGLDPEMDLSTWKRVGNALDAAKAKGIDMPFCTCWHSQYRSGENIKTVTMDATNRSLLGQVGPASYRSMKEGLMLSHLKRPPHYLASHRVLWGEQSKSF